MKILAGDLRGRNIFLPKEVRPVLQVVRKACFDILREEVEGKDVLDLFAGSGAVGIEALSRGANKAYFIDSRYTCIKSIKRSILALKIGEKAEIQAKDSFDAIRDFYGYKKIFGIIFIDPPYYEEMVTKALQQLAEYDILAPSGYVVVFCYVKDDFSGGSDGLTLLVKKKYGQTLLAIYRKDI